MRRTAPVWPKSGTEAGAKLLPLLRDTIGTYTRFGLLRWAVHERRKLRAHRRRFPDLPQAKNHGAFGPETTLQAVATKAIAEHAHMSDDEMHERRIAGHAAASRH